MNWLLGIFSCGGAAYRVDVASAPGQPAPGRATRGLPVPVAGQSWAEFSALYARVLAREIDRGRYDRYNPYYDDRYGFNIMPLEGSDAYQARMKSAAAWFARLRTNSLRDQRSKWMDLHNLTSDPWNDLDLSLAAAGVAGTLTASRDRNYRPTQLPIRGRLSQYVRTDPTDPANTVSQLSALRNRPGVYTGGGTGGSGYAYSGSVLLITGSRGYSDYAKIRAKIAEAAAAPGGLSRVVHGGAAGADMLAERAARELGIPTLIYIPKWGSGSSYNRAAGHQRNSAMLWQNIDASGGMSVAAFFAGRATPGTSGMVEKAIKAGLHGSTTGLTPAQRQRLIDDITGGG